MPHDVNITRQNFNANTDGFDKPGILNRIVCANQNAGGFSIGGA